MLKLGADIEYVLYDKNDNFKPANTLVRFKELCGKSGGYGHDGCSSVFEIRPNPAGTADTLCRHIDELLTLSKQKIGECEMFGGAYHEDYGIGCHVHFGVGMDALRGESPALAAALAFPVKCLFKPEVIEKRIGATGYGKASSNQFRTYRGYHTEYRTLPNFVVNKKITWVVFNYIQCVMENFFAFSSLRNVEFCDMSDSEYDTFYHNPEKLMLTTHSYLKKICKNVCDVRIKNMIKLIEMSPCINPLVSVNDQWLSEPQQLLIRKNKPAGFSVALKFTNDELLQVYSTILKSVSMPKLLNPQITVYGVSDKHSSGIYVSSILIKAVQRFFPTGGHDIANILVGNLGDNHGVSLRTPDFGEYTNVPSIGISRCLRVNSKYNEVVTQIIRYLVEKWNSITPAEMGELPPTQERLMRELQQLQQQQNFTQPNFRITQDENDDDNSRSGF